MTIDPEDFTDEHGRLRPGVARALQDVPDRPLPPPREAPRAAAPVIGAVEVAPATPVVPATLPAPVFDLPPRRVAAAARYVPDPAVPERPRHGFPVREIRIPVPDIAAMRFGIVPFVLMLALAAAAAGLVGLRLGSRTSVGIASATGAPAATFAAPSTESVNLPANGTVSGVNVNLRTGPGLGYSIAAGLQQGEPVTVRDERTGWYSVTTSSGAAGWVFGAYVSGVGARDQSPAIVRRMLVRTGGQGQVVLRPGDRVLHLLMADGRSAALLPDGQRVFVEEGALADAR
jgi:uncharacterized protein YraI